MKIHVFIFKDLICIWLQMFWCPDVCHKYDIDQITNITYCTHMLESSCSKKSSTVHSLWMEKSPDSSLELSTVFHSDPLHTPRDIKMVDGPIDRPTFAMVTDNNNIIHWLTNHQHLTERTQVPPSPFTHTHDPTGFSVVWVPHRTQALGCSHCRWESCDLYATLSEMTHS